MEITIKPVANKHELKTFIFLPEKIHQHHQGWVHPLYTDHKLFFNAKRNKSFLDKETVLALAYNQNGQAVGRVMGIINPVYNQLHNERNARFCFLECYHDFAIAKTLLSYIEDWARSKGMAKLVGPLGFSDKDPQGMLISGFDERVVIETNYNFPWMKDFLEQAGYMKEVDLVSYKFNIPDKIPDYLSIACERALRNGTYRMQEFTTKRELRPWIVSIFRLINETYQHIYGFIPLSEPEMHELINRFLFVLNPRYIKLVTTNDGELIAFLASMPELSEGIRKAKGRLWPVGWYHILRESKRTRLLTMLLGAVKSSHRGKGLDAALGISILKSAHKAGIETIDSHLILETNLRMRAEFERIGGIVHKQYRIFKKGL